MISKDRDATKTSRGFNYQRQYAIYLFFESLITKQNVVKIIEEGKIDGLNYEDITLIYNDNTLSTYQTKHHSTKMRLCRSNEDLFKTINNVNNMNENVRNILFIVSKLNIGETFDDKLTKWKNKELSVEEIYVMLKNLNKVGGKKVKAYRKYCELVEQKTQEIMVSYLGKIQIEQGLTYKDLIEYIHKMINCVFKLNDNDKIVLYYIYYSVFKEFDNNFFRENPEPLDISSIYKTINLSIGNKENTENIDDLCEKTIIMFIEKLSKNINKLFISNLIVELKDFIKNDNIVIRLQLKHYIVILHILHKIYTISSRINDINDIKKLYSVIRKKMCSCFIKYINQFYDGNKFDECVQTINYYYQHDIKHKVCIDKCELKNILTNEDKIYIRKYI